ncbi:MAG: hypothetical protein JWN86_2518 [Planctomycetota bacterium]|nr:hypothetical protein [Planctomycetota bacterium]
MLPDGDGEAIVKEIQARGWPTRVVVSSAVNDPARLAALVDSGAVVVLHKPSRLQDILAAFAQPDPPDRGQ